MKKIIEYFAAVIFVLVISSFVLLKAETRSYLQTYTKKSETEKFTMNNNIELNEDDILRYIIERVKVSYVEDIDNKKILEGAAKGILSSLDPHSTYLSEKDFKEMRIQTKGEFGGLGIVIVKDIETNFIKVVSPIDNTPAQRAGVISGDYISEINDKSTYDMNVEQAAEIMRGKVGEKVKIVILRRGETKPLEFNLKRENIKIESVKSKMEKNGILYIRISNFVESTHTDVISEINKNIKNDIKGLVLDLRNNPGGLLDQSVKVSEIFLDGNKTVVSMKGKNGQFFEEYKTKNKKAYISDIPIVILVNEGSASASEIVAGALQDHKIAVIMGEKTFGKASVQQVFPIPNVGAIKLTIARYYTPSGRSIQLDGIEPDIEVKKAEIKYNKGIEIREKDLKGHLENKENDIVNKKIKENKEESETTDYQLLRALDFINGMNFMKNDKK